MGAAQSIPAPAKPPRAKLTKDPHFHGGFGFWVMPPGRGVVGTEMLTASALGVTSGLRKVTPDVDSLGFRGSRASGVQDVG